MDDQARARASQDIEDAVLRALEAGMNEQEVKDEVDYALENYEPENAGPA